MWQNRDFRSEEDVFKRRLYVLFLLGILFLGYIESRLFYIQIIKGLYFKSISEQNRIQVFNERAPRGRIIGKNNKIIIDNRITYSAVLTKLNYDIPVLKNTVTKLKKFIDLDEVSLQKEIDKLQDKPFEFVYVANDIPREMMIELKEQSVYLPGLSIITEPVRQYHLGYESSHVFGYLSQIDPDELNHLEEEGYKSGDLIGKMGIEKLYDFYLRGEDGSTKIEVDVKGCQRRVIEEVESKVGNDLYVTIDPELQKFCEGLLKSKMGTIIAMSPKTGEIVALVSSPGYDASQFLYPLSDEKIKVLLDKSHPMLNRAIQSQYEPGSVFKIITSIAGLEEKKIYRDTFFTCRGFETYGKEKRKFRCWNLTGHGRIGFDRAFYDSCDVYYYNVGLILGPNRIANYAQMFGLGTYSGIDLPSEKKGCVPDPRWKKEKFGLGWYDGDTVNMAIGQGFVLVTPIQLANMVSVVANGGDVYRPYIVKKIVSPQGKIVFENKPLLLKHVAVSKETMDIVLDAMKEVVDKGTGMTSFIKGLNIAGKTGTAQNPHGDDHSWFVACAPRENPELVVCVFIENGGHGGAVSGPIAKEVFKKYFGVE
jgi:penicillin-binding protein 2